MLELVSGGAFLATTHRVLAGGDGSDSGRISVPFFHNPRLDAVIRTADGCERSRASTLALLYLCVDWSRGPRAHRVAFCTRRLPPELLDVARRRRDVSAGKLDGNRHNRIESSYGANMLKVFIRAMPIVFETHHPDLLAAEKAAIADSASRIGANALPRL